MKDMKNNILSSKNSLKEKFLNLKEIFIKNLQSDNEKFRQTSERLESCCTKYKFEHNTLVQYGCRSNVILSGIPDPVSDDTLEESVISVLADTDVYVERQDKRACHRFGKADRKKWKKIIVQLVNKKKCKKFLSDKKKLGEIDSRMHNFSNSTNTFASKNLTNMSDSIAYNCCKLKHNGLTHDCFSRDDIIRIKAKDRARAVKIFHLDKLHQPFPNFDLGNADEDDDIFLNAFQVANDLL